ncbi:hypothetical protein EDB81DRAFT_810193 [Dactylonectria macrodidyma]|uniref:DUF676 domain-containing protein n=1 Tax=Dactylonectria macrodidyma TaxID=307937 RepID=A0A9P9IMN3_9HYPO|nr:hypothetical protein EDB81DRAFT_810193 [Dactylonectria macrodidyma]
MTWGYYSGVTRSFFGAANSKNISQRGNNLMLMLQEERKDDPTRPLIFVAHSLGGLVVKAALSISKQSTRQPWKRNIYLSTTGIIFLGTPHGGSGVADWGLIASNLTRLAMQGAWARAPKGLTPNDEPLEDLRKTFMKLLEEGHFRIHSFYETLPITGISGLHGLVVPHEFASVGHEKKETSLGIHGTHDSICKFGATSDPGYQAVLCALQDYVNGAVSDSQYANLPKAEP